MLYKLLQNPLGCLTDHNSEHPELYPLHPFRVFGVGKPDMAAAELAYARRAHPCNIGWCQDVVDAAMLGKADDAARMVADRAAHPQTPFRFEGFAGNFQDFAPSSDHFGFMRTAMHYMLVAPLDDALQRVILFPAWPADWDVEFRLHAPRNTTIEAACINGTLTKLVVEPSPRRVDVIVRNCRQAREKEQAPREEFVI